MPDVLDKPTVNPTDQTEVLLSKWPGGRVKFSKENAKAMSLRAAAARRAKAQAIALSKPPEELPEQISAHVRNIRRQLERVHERLMGTPSTKAMEHLAKVQAQLIASEKELLKTYEVQKQPAPPSSVPPSSWQSGAISKSVAAAK